MPDSIWAIGLMSGTSGDGIDAALLKTDGTRIVETGPGIGEARRSRNRSCQPSESIASAISLAVGRRSITRWNQFRKK